MKSRSLFYLALGAIGLFLTYLFQDYLDFHAIIFEARWPEKLDYATSYSNTKAFPFVVNKVLRYLLNDLFSIAIIYGIFGERKYVRFAFYVMIFGMLILLPTYLWLYLAKPEGFSSMVSHLHRVVMNPVLMMLLIPAFVYQKKVQEHRT